MKNWLEHKPESFFFKGKWIHNWFSNMSLCEIVVDGKTYPSTENYYQAMKSLDEDIQLQISVATPSQSKQMGRRIKIREDWEEVKVEFMRKALEAKFTQNEFYKGMLLATCDFTGIKDDVIVEWNNWGDKEWGADWKTGIGNNKLGILLMEVREKLKI